MQSPLDFFDTQLKQWPLAADNYNRLEQALTRTVELNNSAVFNDRAAHNDRAALNGNRLVLQVNPGRLASTAANTTASAILERPCFLCDANRPPEQQTLDVPGEPRFTLLVNPFPVFPRHFTIIGTHQPQRLTPYIDVLFRLAQWLDNSVVFYNGARCGASAPDHLHFQAGNKGIIPIQTDIDAIRDQHTVCLLTQENASLFQLTGLSRGGWLLEGKDDQELCRLAIQLMKTLQAYPFNTAMKATPSMQIPQVAPFTHMQHTDLTEAEEPMINALCWYGQQVWHLVLFYRKAHRPSCYFRQDEHQRLISPAAVEMGGLVIAARQKDFEDLSAAEISRIFNEVSWDDETITRCSHHFLRHFIQQ